MQGGVDMSHVIWRDFDGLGKNTRVGLNFTEKGFGIRPALGCSDRGHSAASQIRPGEVNWEKLFGRRRRALVPDRRHLRCAGLEYGRSRDRSG